MYRLPWKKVRCFLLIPPKGADPKSVLCAYFKAGLCTKGAKCKYSHDLALDGKSAKIDLYSDPRDKKPDYVRPANRTHLVRSES